MKKRFLVTLSALALASATPALAAPGDIADVVEQQRQHGFGSPALAIRQLTGLRADLASEPVDVRMRYHNTLAALYIGAEQPEELKQSLAELDRMASAEKCLPCGYYKIVREIHQANRKQDLALANQLLVKLDTVTTGEPNLMQAIHYVRGVTFESSGSHARAIEEGIKASQLAIDTHNPAEQVRSLNLLMLANIGRRDLPRAEALADEAYKLAERIGFVYMMAYVRGNQAWIHSLKGEHEKTLRALTDALKITREHPGLTDAELVNLVNLADYYVEQKAYKQAIEVAGQAVVLADKQDKLTAKGVAMGSLARSQVELGEADKGVATAQAAVALLEKSGAKGYVLDAVNMQALVYERAGRHRESVQTLRKYMALKDEATLREREKTIAEAQEKFSGERKDHEIERLSLENGRREAEVAARAWQQRLWATAALALGLGGVLLVQMMARTRRRNRALEDSNAVLSDQSVHDPLTGAFNRRHCVALMGQQEAMLATKVRERNYSASCGLLLLDVDHFKHINDTWGHSAGDVVLVEIARRLQELVRQHDVVVRWGGEEFVLVLPGTAPEGMLVLAERALRVVAQEPVLADGNAIPVTVSAGCVSYPLFQGQAWQDALKVADAAMYMAKQAGRNRALCLMSVAEGAPREQLMSDLSAAAAAGHVSLNTVHGPVGDCVGAAI